MNPVNLNPVPDYRLELSPAFQLNFQPNRYAVNLALDMEWRGLRAGMSFSGELWSGEERRASVFLDLGYRHYFNRHHAIQVTAMVGGDVSGALVSSTLYLINPAYVWFPGESQNLGLLAFLQTGVEVFSLPLQQSDRAVWAAGLGLVWALPASGEERPRQARSPLDPERCAEIQSRQQTTSFVTTIYFDEEAAQVAADCLNQIRRN